MARLLFVGVVTLSDDFGFFTASPHTLRLEIFPSDRDIDNDTVEGWRNQLLDKGLVEMYGADGKRYLWIPTFEKWQRMKYHAKSRILETLEAAGIFEVDRDGKNRPIACRPKSEPVTDFRCNGKVSVAKKSFPCRAVPCRAIDGGSALLEPAPPSESTATDTAGNALVSMDGNGNDTPRALHWKAKEVLDRWGPASPDFRMWKQLRLVIQMRDDVENVLTHLIDLDEASSPIFAPAAMWKRLHPKGGPVITPSESAIDQASKIMNEDMEKLAAELPALGIGSDVGKPAAVKKKGKA